MTRKRVITFGLTCVLSCAVCFGLTIAIVAGIAYGYNYSMAEFLMFTRSDITVYMKRGQFPEDSESQNFRRRGSDDLFSANSSLDYEVGKPRMIESQPLADTWMKSQDTRKYAEILTKYSPKKGEIREPEPDEPSPDREFNQFLRSTQDSSVISIMPNPLMPTVSWRSGSSNIMMRNFKPLQEYTSANSHTERPESLIPERGTKPQSIYLNPRPKGNDHKKHDGPNSFGPMRVWHTTARAVIPDEPEDVDEDNIVYRPV